MYVCVVLEHCSQSYAPEPLLTFIESYQVSARVQAQREIKNCPGLHPAACLPQLAGKGGYCFIVCLLGFFLCVTVSTSTILALLSH